MTKRGVEGRAVRSQRGPDRPSPPGDKVAGDQTSVWPQGAPTWVGTRPAARHRSSDSGPPAREKITTSSRQRPSTRDGANLETRPQVAWAWFTWAWCSASAPHISLWSMSSQQPLSAPCTRRQGGLL